MLLSPMLKKGDRVRLVSPASYPTSEWVEESLTILDSWGLVGEVGRHALDKWGYMAGSDQHRLDDLNQAFRDPGVRAIITTRGGAGAYRIADRIDFDAVLADPKPLVGFSDITSIHLSLLHRCGLAAIHGSLFGITCQPTVRQLLMTTKPVTLKRNPTAVSASLEVSGRASGPLIGGNLAMLATSVGVRIPDLDGAILFLEDQRVVGLGTIDRQLTQLISSGTLDGIAGIALGSFEAFRDYSDRGWTLADVLADRLGSLGVPVLGGLFAGHDLVDDRGNPDQSGVPLGTISTIDTATGTLTTNPIVHETSDFSPASHPTGECVQSGQIE
jgi:muramoyltetrapeptide carboxypeptidase